MIRFNLDESGQFNLKNVVPNLGCCLAVPDRHLDEFEALYATFVGARTDDERDRGEVKVRLLSPGSCEELVALVERLPWLQITPIILDTGFNDGVVLTNFMSAQVKELTVGLSINPRLSQDDRDAVSLAEKLIGSIEGQISAPVPYAKALTFVSGFPFALCGAGLRYADLRYYDDWRSGIQIMVDAQDPNHRGLGEEYMEMALAPQAGNRLQDTRLKREGLDSLAAAGVLDRYKGTSDVKPEMLDLRQLLPAIQFEQSQCSHGLQVADWLAATFLGVLRGRLRQRKWFWRLQSNIAGYGSKGFVVVALLGANQAGLYERYGRILDA